MSLSIASARICESEARSTPRQVDTSAPEVAKAGVPIGSAAKGREALLKKSSAWLQFKVRG